VSQCRAFLFNKGCFYPVGGKSKNHLVLASYRPLPSILGFPRPFDSHPFKPTLTLTKMFSTFLTVALFLAPALQGALAEFAVSTPPELTQCGDGHVGWEPTTGPYNVFVVNPEDPCGEELAHLGETGDTWIDFPVTFASGTNVQLYIEDANGDDAWSGSVTVSESSDGTCLEGGDAAAAAAGGAAPTHSTSPSPSVAPIGAANAGTNPIGNAASSVRQINTPLMALGAIAAFVAVGL